MDSAGGGLLRDSSFLESSGYINIVIMIYLSYESLSSMSMTTTILPLLCVINF